MNLIDKLLMGILVLLLPIGIWISYALITNKADQVEEVSIDVVKLKEMTDRFAQLELAAQRSPLQLLVSKVSYATASGNLTVEGVAPSGDMSVMMSATVLPPPTTLPADEVLGSQIEYYAIPTQNNGTFSMQIPVGKTARGIMEIRLEQNEIVRTVRFDLDRQSQLY